MPDLRSRDEALMRSLVAMHAVLSVREGKFFSLTDPPEALREATAACRNLGAWPVLVGAPGEQDAMLASPIILYDYPQIAPESPGDLFDGTEIDEILTLRIMTLTEEEKAMAGATDDRTRRLIERTESLAREQLAGLHGAVRSLSPRLGWTCAGRLGPDFQSVHDAGHPGRPVRRQRIRQPIESIRSTTSNCGRATGCGCGRGWEATSSTWP